MKHFKNRVVAFLVPVWAWSVPVFAAETAAPKAQKTEAASSKAKTSAPIQLNIDQVRALQSNIKETEHLSVDFVQTRFTALRGKTIKRDGKAQFSRPNLFRWRLENPTKELIFDGKAFFEFDPTTQSAAKYAASGANARELSQIVDLVLNFDSLLKRYDLVSAEDLGTQVKILLKPKNEQEIKAVELHYNKTSDFVSYVALELANGNKLTHEFASPQRKAISSKTYTLPEGVKVTDTN